MKLTTFKKTVFSFFLALISCSCLGQTAILSENAKLSVLTCGTANESYSLFGHTAIRISDEPNYIDVVYNYGAFDFNTPNFVVKFSKGDLEYFAITHSFKDFITDYQLENRAVYEQELNIPLNLKQQLFDNLNAALSSENSHYTYKFIDKNCTSMIVDMINKTLKGTVIQKANDTKLTYRSILYPYFDKHFYEKLGTSIIFGKKVDDLGNHLFLPFELLVSLKSTSFQGHPLAKETKTLLESQLAPESSWWNNVYTYLLLLFLIIILNSRKIDLFYYLTMGSLGAFFIFMGFYSNHQELQYNYNILLFNPSLIGVAYFYINKNMGAIVKLVYFNLISMGIYLLILINKAHFLIVLPLIITNLILLGRLYFNSKKDK